MSKRGGIAVALVIGVGLIGFAVIAGGALAWLMYGDGERESAEPMATAAPDPPPVVAAAAADTEATRARVEGRMRSAMLNYPSLVGHLGALPYAQARIEGQRLVRRGIPRLPDDELLRMTRLRLRLMATSEAMCAAQHEGYGSEDIVITALGTLSDHELAEWSQLSADAAYLENASGERPLTADQAAASISTHSDPALQHLSEADRTRFAALRAEPHPAPRDACFLARSTYESALQLPPSDAAAYLRALTETAIDR